MSFVSLHVHDYYSLLDSVAKPEALVKKAKALGMPALGITNHGHLFSHLKFYQACQKEGLKAVIGVEAYVSQDHTQKVRDQTHLTLLAINQQGYQNLLQLVSKGYTQGFYYAPRIDWTLLEQYREGLVCLTGCLNSEFNKLLLGNQEKELQTWIQRAQSIFQKDLYWEFTPACYETTAQAIELGASMATRYQLTPIATSDVHYVNPEDYQLRDIVWNIRDGLTLSDPKARHDTVKEYYLMGAEEVKEKSQRYQIKPALVEQALASTMDIASRSNVILQSPQYLVVQFCAQPEQELIKRCEQHRSRLRLESAVYRERLQMELAVIQRMGLANYFLVVQDVLEFCQREKIMTGPGRGSAAGSLVCYVLGITKVDPVVHGLLFERFLNAGRADSYPDIDTDIAHEDRDRVVAYLKTRYGSDRVAQIITFSSMAARAVLKDVGRTLGKTAEEMNALTKLIPFKIDGAPIQSLEQVMEQAPEIQEQIKAYQETFDLARQLDKTPRHASVHASALLITPQPIDQLAPLYRDPKSDAVVCGMDMYDCETRKLLKFDFLGLKTLSVEQRTLALIEQHHQKVFDLNNLNLHDPRVWDLFCQGHTVGTFQTETPVMQHLLKKIQPRSLQELSVVNALDRPGPLNKGMDTLYTKRKRGQEPLHPIHESIEHILKPTYQTLIYQEQVMQIAEVFSGFSKNDADVLRKSMGKKKRELVLKMKEQFIEGAVTLGRPREVAEHLFTLIEEFSEYAFNMSHSLAYSLISYSTAYLKVHYPLEFMCATLNVFANDQEEMAKYLQECRRMKIAVLPPDINVSAVEFTIEGTGIRFGFSAIRDIGTEVSSELMTARPYTTIEDALTRWPVNKKAGKALIFSGAMDRLHRGRKGLWEFYSEEKKKKPKKPKTTKPKSKKAKSQEALFEMKDLGGVVMPEVSTVTIPMTQESPIVEALHEKAYLGVYVQQHPVECLPPASQKLPHQKIGGLQGQIDMVQRAEVTIRGMIERTKLRVTKKDQKPMMSVWLSDETGTMEVVVFPKLFAQAEDALGVGNMVRMSGNISEHQLLAKTCQLLVGAPKT
ncbi:DNA polymerase III subunit alpha [Candidatus Woesearchaeota archaeon]|nr:DNA polymerase III subunit alpha [Candidatus Woesearchaeota archaeon]